MLIGVLVIAPVVALIARGLSLPAESSTTGGHSGLFALLNEVHAWHLLWFTLKQAALSVVVTLVAAAPIVWLVVRSGPTVSKIVVGATTVGFILPTVVVGMAFRALMGTGGPLEFLHLDGRLGAVLVAHAFVNVAVVVRVVASVWASLDPRAEEAARTLGAPAWRAFVSVVVPRLAPAIAAASALVFLFCSTSFGIVLVLGNGQLQTVETEIYRQAVDYFDIPAAVALTLLQIVVVAAVVILTVPIRHPPATSTGSPRRHRSLSHRVLLVIAGMWTAVICLSPIAILMLRSIRPSVGGRWTFEGYRSLVTDINGYTPLSALRYSLTSAALAMIFATFVGVVMAVIIHRVPRSLALLGGALLLLPLGISAVTIGFGYLVLLSKLPAALAGSWAVIPVVQALIAVPVVYRIVAPAVASVPRPQRDSAATMGARPIRVWLDVDVPVIARSVSTGAGFAFIMSIGEFGATSFLARPGTTTLPVLIGASLGRPGEQNVAAAMACSVLLAAVTVVATVLIEMLRGAGKAVL